MTDSLHKSGGVGTAQGIATAERYGLTFVFLRFFVGGLAHFAATDLEAQIVPPYIPWPHEIVLIVGVCELLGAFGLVWAATRRMAGIGLFMLTIAVTPANIHMLQHAQQYPVPYWLLWLRLPFQAGLLWLIWWATIRRQKAPVPPSSPVLP
jgi:uncharacterized membrane protein